LGFLFCYSRCSCSLCSSQGARRTATTTRGLLVHGCDAAVPLTNDAVRRRARTSQGGTHEQERSRVRLPQNGTVTSGRPGSGGARCRKDIWGRTYPVGQLASDRRRSSPTTKTKLEVEQCAP